MKYNFKFYISLPRLKDKQNKTESRKIEERKWEKKKYEMNNKQSTKGKRNYDCSIIK